MASLQPRRVAVIGGGPAGLMAAETIRATGHAVDLYEAKGSPGRKFLIAGKGGLNLTHSDPPDVFAARYGARKHAIARWLADFDAQALRDWAGALGVETYVGSSGRVFPLDRKAAPLLRGWVRRLKEQGVQLHVQHRWIGWDSDGALRFATESGEARIEADAVVLALGGASWPQLGSDGAWVPVLEQHGVDIAALQPSNCGFDIAWSRHFAERHAGAPLKPVIAHWQSPDGVMQSLQGECVASADGIEGSLVYAIGADLRAAIRRDGGTTLWLDLAPARSREQLLDALGKPRKGRSFGEHLRRQAGLDSAKAALVFEALGKDAGHDIAAVADVIKRLPLQLLRPRPVAEAISTDGGVRLEALDDALMSRRHPGLFFAGEMLDWDAPTGGYLLTACFASGLRAGRGVVDWLARGITTDA